MSTAKELLQELNSKSGPKVEYKVQESDGDFILYKEIHHENDVVENQFISCGNGNIWYIKKSILDLLDDTY